MNVNRAGAAAFALVFTTAPAPAAGPEHGTATLPRVVVTGSRLTQSGVTRALPVSVIDRDEIERLGATTLGDLLRDLPSNNFGGIGDTPNAVAPVVRLEALVATRVPGLRGLDPKYTLVLLDGHRLAGAPGYLGGVAPDVSLVPLVGIDRIEVWRDAGSAIYGSEALGGVINLVSRAPQDGGRAVLYVERPEARGGDARGAAGVVAAASDTAAAQLAFELDERDPIAAIHRPYLIEVAPIGQRGFPGSYTRRDPATGAVVGVPAADPRCPSSLGDATFPRSVRIPFGPGELCGFRIRDDQYERVGYRRRGLVATARMSLTDRLDAHLRAVRSDRDTEAQLGTSPYLLPHAMPADHPGNPTLGERGAGLGYPLDLSGRLAAFGPRRIAIADSTQHVLAGFEGSSTNSEWTLTVFDNRATQSGAGVGGYGLRDAYLAAIREHRFDPFAALPGEARGLEDVPYVPRSDARARASGATLDWRVDGPRLPHGAVLFALGASWRRDSHTLRDDAESVSGNVLGQTGAVNAASRSHRATYAEAMVPMAPWLEVTGALRRDDYALAGGATSPRVSALFGPWRSVALRASVSEGFQAPDLESAFHEPRLGLGIARDALGCVQRREGCGLAPYPTRNVGNASLEPERARLAAIGAVWEPREGVAVTIDAYRTRIRGQILPLPVQQALDNELRCALAGQPCTRVPDGEVVRDATGQIVEIVLPEVNLAAVDTRGVDLEAIWRGDGALAAFDLTLRATHLVALERHATQRAHAEDLVGVFGHPRTRATLLGGHAWPRHRLSIAARYASGYRACAAYFDALGQADPGCAVQLDPHLEWDAQWQWRISTAAVLGIGVRNLTDERPPLAPSGNYAQALHDVTGRSFQLRYSHAF